MYAPAPLLAAKLENLTYGRVKLQRSIIDFADMYDTVDRLASVVNVACNVAHTRGRR